MSIYTIHKKSGTYSELLETYGLANFLHKIFETVNMSDTDIVITDREYCFEVSTSVDITDEIISKLKYFPPFKYIKQKADSDVSQYPDFYDYPGFSYPLGRQGNLPPSWGASSFQRDRRLRGKAIPPP